MWLGVGHAPLPDHLGDPLQAASDAAVSEVVPKFRNALGAYGAATSRKQQSDLITEYLTWDELIHTSYFKNDRFAKLVAYALSQSTPFRPTDVFRNDPDYSVVAGWYTQIRDSEVSAAQ